MLAGAGCDGSNPDESESGGRKSLAIRTEPVIRPSPPSQGYVGSAACVDCHAEITEAYPTHPMAHSLTKILEEPVEDYQNPVEFEPHPGFVYRVVASESGVTHSEILKDREGTEIYDQTLPVQFAVGSGKRGRSYLINHQGVIFMSPVTWYTEGHRFDLSPGYSAPDHPRFSRRISDGCLVCHSGLIETAEGEPNRYSAEPFLERSIGCERCHGPGRDHIEFHTTSKGNSQSPVGEKDPIVNPADLSPARREDVCNQCHLQGLERILRYGRTEFDFRPGDRLSDVWATFVAGDRIGATGGTTRVVSQVEQMHASRCFQQSKGQLNCTSCHDPHRSPAPEQKQDFYRQRCLVCHTGEGQGCSELKPARLAVQDSCMDCHMPRLDASDVPHTSQTDHRILRSPSSKRIIRDKPFPSNGPRLFRDAETELSEEALQRARGLLLAHAAENGSRPDLARQALAMLQPLAGIFLDDTELLDSLGTLNYLLGDYDSARKYWLQVTSLQPARESSLEGLMLVARQQKRSSEALEEVNRLLELNPWREDYYHHQSQILVDLGRVAESIETSEKGLELHPGSLPLLRSLIEACQKSGEAQKAELYQHRLEKLLSIVPTQPR